MKFSHFGKQLVAVGAGGLGLLAIGCQHEGTAYVREGRSSFEVVAPPPESRELEMAPPGPAQADFVEAIPAYIIERTCAPPVYPARALAANVGARDVVVTVSFDEHGNTTDVAPHWPAVIFLDEFSADFFAAVKSAVMNWKISPPRHVHYRRDRAGEKRYLRTEALATTVDIRFSFDASGRLQTTR